MKLNTKIYLIISSLCLWIILISLVIQKYCSYKYAILIILCPIIIVCLILFGMLAIVLNELDKE